MSRRGEECPSQLVQVASADTLRTALGADAGRWINADQQSLLFFAALREVDCKEVCQLLIDVHGVDPAKTDRRGQTALHYLAKSTDESCVDLLVSRGCDVDHVDGLMWQTALFYAARWGTPAMVRRLVDHQADVNVKDARGQTPMFWTESVEVCEELLRGHGDSCAAVDITGVSVVEFHRRRSQHELVDCLVAFAEVRGLRGRMTWSVQRVDGLEARSGSTSSASSSQGGAGPTGAAAEVGVIRNDRGARSANADAAEAAPGGGRRPYGNYKSYATSLARQRDVDPLCELENEFVEDHRRILDGHNIPEAELWNQIGLNPDAEQRRNTIKSLSQPIRSVNQPVRHYTLKCLHMPPNPARQTGAARARSYSVVGYVYFRLCDGPRKEEDEEEEQQTPAGAGSRASVSKPGPDDGSAAQAATSGVAPKAASPPAACAGVAAAAGKSMAEATAPAASAGQNGAAAAAARDGPGHIVVSHLKVSGDHQRRGVATLLLAGMLQIAENERRGFVCSHLHLSVVARNSSAVALYRDLGFAQTCKDETETVEWLHMTLPLAASAEGAPSTSALRAAWLRRVRGICGSIDHDTPAQSPKRRMLQDAFGLRDTLGRAAGLATREPSLGGQPAAPARELGEEDHPAAETLQEEPSRPLRRRLQTKTSSAPSSPAGAHFAASSITASMSAGATTANGRSPSEALGSSLAKLAR